MNFLCVFFGGGLGAVCRYLISLLAEKRSIFLRFPVATFFTNVLGCFAIGLVVGSAVRRSFGKNTTLFLKTGFCGGFTTFSTFSLEAARFLEARNFLFFVAYIFLSIVFCLVGVFCGIKFAK